MSAFIGGFLGSIPFRIRRLALAISRRSVDFRRKWAKLENPQKPDAAA